MIQILRAAAVLSALLLSAGPTGSASIADRPPLSVEQKKSDTSADIRGFIGPETGPGYPQFTAPDEYAGYQWGLFNDGTFKLIQKWRVLPTQDLVLDDQTPASGRQNPVNGPGNYSNTITDAVSGVDINIQPAWDVYAQSPVKNELIVAVIDTGIDYNHEDLKDNIWTNPGEIPDDGIDNDGNGFIDDVHGWNFYSNNNQIYVGPEDSHGTHAAGTIAAKMDDKGVTGIGGSGFIKIMPIKVLGTAEGIGTTESVIQAINYAQANGAVICNLSFGAAAYREDLEMTIAQSPMLFVVAAGNGDLFGNGYDTDLSPIYPASFGSDNIISVANLMFDGRLGKSSNFGMQTVDIAAPGSYILSTTTDNTYSYMTGTSMSAPMVTGVAALLYSTHPDWSIQDVRSAILETARKLETLEGKVGTGGMLDADGAFHYIPHP